MGVVDGRVKGFHDGHVVRFERSGHPVVKKVDGSINEGEKLADAVNYRVVTVQELSVVR